MMNLFVPLSVTVCGAATQVVALRSPFCCNVKPVEGDDHETMAVLVVVRRMLNNGAPGVCTAKSDQNPPVNEKLPPVIGCSFASGWPMVPLSEYTPPVLVPPPPSMVNQSMVKDWAWDDRGAARTHKAATKSRQVLECGSPLPLSGTRRACGCGQSGRGLPHSK